MSKKLILVPVVLLIVAVMAGGLILARLSDVVSDLSVAKNRIESMSKKVSDLQSGSGGQTTQQSSDVTVAFGSVTGGTAGSVIFSDGTTLAQDNANLFWNDSANSLGVGTNTPGTGTRLSVNGIVLSDILSAEDHLKAGFVEATSTVATSTFAGGLTASSSVEVTGRITASPRKGCVATTTLDFSESSVCISITGDRIVMVDTQNKPMPNQKLTAWIYHDHTGLNSDLGFATRTAEHPYTFLGIGGLGTTTTSGDLDICTFAAETGATGTVQMIAVNCSGPYSAIQR